MLYAAGVSNHESMKNSPQVGIGSVWWEGNPCNGHLLGLGNEVKRAVEKQGMIAWQYNTVGVSDGITMGNEGARCGLLFLCSPFCRRSIMLTRAQPCATLCRRAN